MRIRELRFITVFCVVGLCALAVVRGWEIVVSQTARSAVLNARYNAADPDSVLKRRDELAGLLAQRPASSLNWILLAQAQLQSGQRTDSVMHALALSAVTGPNEGAVMAERARLEVVLWESMPPDLKKRAIEDLANFDLSGDVNPGLALSLKPQSAHDEIVAALQKAPGMTDARLQKLGVAR